MSLLTQAEIGLLHEALDDEYKAWTTYDQVIHDFGRERRLGTRARSRTRARARARLRRLMRRPR
jgi:hypothetical protein